MKSVSPLHETINTSLYFHFFSPLVHFFLFTVFHTMQLGHPAQALERQKEYTDAIRIERDELREEVVNLKDILKVLSQCVNAYFSPLCRVSKLLPKTKV